MQPLHTYTCTACGSEWTTTENMVYCPRCYHDGGHEEILIYVEADNQPPVISEIEQQRRKAARNMPPLELDGNDIDVVTDTLNQYLNNQLMALKALQDAGNCQSPEFVKGTAAAEKTLATLGKFQNEGRRRAAIADERLAYFQSGAS